MEFPNPAKMRNFREFDNHFTAPVHGFGTAANYYDTCSSRQFLRSIEKPTLILHARDDPFMTPDVVPHESELSSSVEFELSQHGGHVGFAENTNFRELTYIEPRFHRFLQEQKILRSN